MAAEPKRAKLLEVEKEEEDSVDVTNTTECKSKDSKEKIYAEDFQCSLPGLRCERVFRDPLDPLHADDNHLLQCYGFPRVEILSLVHQLEPEIGKIIRRTHEIPTHSAVLVSLRYYISGSYQFDIGDTPGIRQPNVLQVINEVTNALFKKARVEIKMPKGTAGIADAKRNFYRISSFPNIIGVIDCTHIPIKAPSENNEAYINKNKFHSINVQVVASCDLTISSACPKYPGSTADFWVWRNSHLRQRFEKGEFGKSYLLGDIGYPSDPYILTPFDNPFTQAEENYNQCLSRTRSVIEQTFVTLKSRFRCLHKSGGSLMHEPIKCMKIILSCMLLHNYCIKSRIPLRASCVDLDDLPRDIVHRKREHAVRKELVEKYFSR